MNSAGICRHFSALQAGRCAFQDWRTVEARHKTNSLELVVDGPGELVGDCDLVVGKYVDDKNSLFANAEWLRDASD